ncbi:SURF1 family protein [Terrabacter sp. NPDC080008]|uniref:SURF1 family cytochrome oxidase biogenesis protein n=1 Tax=Terrabacter sp. NPDC080008 TaxID=3155176 RepID=UPI00344FF4C9
MLRLWLTRRWLLATLAAVVFGVACYYLGLWQWHRHVEQRTKVDAIATNYGAAPVPFSPALVERPLTPERQWTHVTLTGTYAANSDLMVRNRTLNSTVGFEVLTPLQTDGLTVLVDRGWVANGANAETVPPVDPPPAGAVAVTGWLRTGEVSLGRDVPRPQLVSINIADARAQVPSLSNVDAYVVLGSQRPSSASAGHPLQPLPKPEEDLGPHQAYAYQWWLFMPGGLAFIFFAIRRQAAAVRETEGGPYAAPPKPKKVRIWDEEDA